MTIFCIKKNYFQIRIWIRIICVINSDPDPCKLIRILKDPLYSAPAFIWNWPKLLYLDVVWVGPLVPVPEQHVDPVDDAGHPQHHHDPCSQPSYGHNFKHSTLAKIYNLHILMKNVSYENFFRKWPPPPPGPWSPRFSPLLDLND